MGATISMLSTRCKGYRFYAKSHCDHTDWPQDDQGILEWVHIDSHRCQTAHAGQTTSASAEDTATPCPLTTCEDPCAGTATGAGACHLTDGADPCAKVASAEAAATETDTETETQAETGDMITCVNPCAVVSSASSCTPCTKLRPGYNKSQMLAFLLEHLEYDCTKQELVFKVDVRIANDKQNLSSFAVGRESLTLSHKADTDNTTIVATGSKTFTAPTLDLNASKTMTLNADEIVLKLPDQDNASKSMTLNTDEILLKSQDQDNVSGLLVTPDGATIFLGTVTNQNRNSVITTTTGVEITGTDSISLSLGSSIHSGLQIKSRGADDSSCTGLSEEQCMSLIASSIDIESGGVLSMMAREGICLCAVEENEDNSKSVLEVAPNNILLKSETAKLQIGKGEVTSDDPSCTTEGDCMLLNAEEVEITAGSVQVNGNLVLNYLNKGQLTIDVVDDESRLIFNYKTRSGNIKKATLDFVDK